MARANLIISGTGAGATFNAVPLTEINTISLPSIAGERVEIDLTTLTDTDYLVGLLSELVENGDVVINKKFDPAADMGHTQENALLLITFKVGESTTKTFTCWAQFNGFSPGTVEREPGDGINVDLTFVLTNLNGSLVETGPVIS